MKNDRILWYVADPMCSWCWGFSPVITSIKEKYKDKINISLLLGGLRPGTTAPISSDSRDEIFHHWREVHKRTNQPFMFDGALPEGFVYDTEPPSRAVLAVSEIKPEQTFDFFHALQEAFYANNQDITKEDVLINIATQFDVEPDDFKKHFQSDEIKNRTQAHFQSARQAGIQGFPTCVLQNKNEHKLLSNGYRELAALESEINAWLES